MSEAITAFATVVMAVFTGVLVWVTNRQATLTKEALISTQRAFVHLKDFFPEIAFRQDPRAITRFVVKPQWRNAGTTPTRAMKVWINWTPWIGPNLPNDKYIYGENVLSMVLGPEDTEWSEPIAIPPQEATAAMNGHSHIFIWGKAEYRDVFDSARTHVTRWCYRVHFAVHDNRVEPQFIAYGDYNDSN